MTSYVATGNERIAVRRLSLEISVPWRLFAVALCMVGMADIVAIELSGAVATAMLFTAYGAIAAAATMIMGGRRRIRSHNF